MDDLKTLIEAVAHLPQLAIWVVVAFWAYKVVFVGSIYGVARLLIIKGHSAITDKQVNVRPILDGMAITGSLELLILQIKRLSGIHNRNGLSYIHKADVDWLRDAIDDKIAKDSINKQ